MLYPPIQCNRSFHLPVGSTHQLYVEESGSSDGLPVVFLHGGPGASCEPIHRRFFNPERYRIILFDQRGSGKSRPHASLQENTTSDLIDDLETIRQHLKIDRWVLFGGSWGSTLALLYAQAFPERVMGLVLRGIFLARVQDIGWFYQRGGASRLFPDAWQKFIEPIPEGERDDMVAAYARRLTGENELERMAAAKAWSAWEGSTATLRPSDSLLEYFADPHVAFSIARIEAHYFVNHCFIEQDQVLRDMPRINHLPGFIVHGRYDAICPIDQAFELHQRWPGSELKVIGDAGHAASEPDTARALVACCDELLHMLDDSVA